MFTSSSSRRPPSSFLSSRSRNKAADLDDSSSESAAEDGFDDGEDLNRSPLSKKSTPRSQRKSGSLADSSSRSLNQLPPRPHGIAVDDDSDETPLVPPSSSRRKLQKRPATANDSDETPMDPPSSSRRKLQKRPITADDSDEDVVVQPTKRRRLVRRGSSPASSGSNNPSSGEPHTPPPPAGESRDRNLYTLMKRGVRRSAQSARSGKQKQMELLRRRRAGEVIEEQDLSSSEDEDHKGIYDTDSDNPALYEFDDDDEDDDGDEGPEPVMRSNKAKGKESDQEDLRDLHDQNQDDLGGFIVNDDDAPLGVPSGLAEIPLEFTAQAHKPMKEHFKDAVKWLVQLKINPGFSDKKHPVYMRAWQKLDDEVRGLAVSKFESAAWKPDFLSALRARPAITTEELPRGDTQGEETCMACGRRNHPARSVISFQGSAYHKKIADDHFLQDLTSDSDSGSDDSAEGGGADYDEDGSRIPKEKTRWYVGSVCSQNAETTHGLMHWKHQLMEFVNEALEADKYMRPEKVQQREGMEPEERHELVDRIVKSWVKDNTMKDLYGSFKQALETARNKTTTGKVTRGR